jgi:hypothetical protein
LAIGQVATCFPETPSTTAIAWTSGRLTKMRFQRHAPDLAAGRRIQYRQRAIAETDDDLLGPGVDTDIVGIATELDLSGRLVAAAVQQSGILASS